LDTTVNHSLPWCFTSIDNKGAGLVQWLCHCIFTQATQIWYPPEIYASQRYLAKITPMLQTKFQYTGAAREVHSVKRRLFCR